MSKYLSIETIMTAFSLLHTSLTAGTHFSALQYFFALDNYVHNHGNDCDTGSCESEFISFAHKVAGLDDGEVPDHIDGFTGKRPKKDRDAARIHSNFISQGAVKSSLRATREDPELYPSGKNKYLFAISKKVLLADSIRYDHLDNYLPSKKVKTAFAVWVTRNSIFEDGQSFEDELKDVLSRSYTNELVAALWRDGAPSPSDIGLSENIFTSEKPNIGWSVIENYISTDGSENERPNPSEAVGVKETGRLTGDTVELPHNWIFFGAPGTGKSHQLNELAKKSFPKANITRVTFYPDYTYSQFVGCFKPYSDQESAGITYKYVAGPFLETYLKAISHPSDTYVLLIEEINRANPAAVFGDVFQLLDRGKGTDRDYAVTTSAEMGDCIGAYLDRLTEGERRAIEDYYDAFSFTDFREMERKTLFLPPNMYIWATMNSADQGVYPMDTAFRRRWDFKYIGINDGADAVIDGVALDKVEVPCGKQTVKWNDLRIAINNFLLSDGIRVNEDKLLGPFFIAPSSLTPPENFTRVFENKVLMYLYEDAGKPHRNHLFRSDLKTYAQVCEAYENEGTAIFGDGFIAPESRGNEHGDSDEADHPQE